ncbi:hypothetical protein [Lactiplantibacillus pentosus]|uniref:hypothetical protein n=1 Tax=Lactiplantibacillus pentosus TaxID=1589 RepID=UPI001401D7A9|nr:hypothetical protein [Lactiplantibacillus pentosus]MBU7480289.1 hypothetical protein [Lactiplantibacillus pentosus]MBU7504176.1 hypothetical protein [Lactiplantibacillus pentosus]MDY1544077.1 hypothetical protein [Lactiplantibacillus pentosus]
MKLIPNTTPATSQAFSSLVTCLGQYDWCGIEPHAVANLLTWTSLSGDYLAMLQPHVDY